MKCDDDMIEVENILNLPIIQITTKNGMIQALDKIIAIISFFAV